MRRFVITALLVAGVLAGLSSAAAETSQERVTFKNNEKKGELSIRIDGQEALVYQYGPDEDLAHYWPVRSPSGKSMTVQHPDPYPHHRSFWFADHVQLEGERDANFYNAWYTREKEAEHECPFKDRVRHVEFLDVQQPDGPARKLAMKLVWEMDWDKTVLSEHREMRIVPLDEGEYFLDITFTVTATNGDVKFVSDWVHYAWPYVRMNKQFNVKEGGGTIISSTGAKNRKGTNGKEAKWVDYSTPVDDKTEGLAIFSHPDNPSPHRWLTRDYGCFGPRRIRKRSGERFTLENGDSMTRRVGILVHNGNVKSGNVAERFEKYVNGDL